MDLPKAMEVVYHAIDMVNDLRSENDQVAKAPDVVLAGEGGCLDSLALATLILAVERRVADLSGQEVTLLDESEFDPQFTRFASPSALAALIVEKLAP
jgi:hypothetical protein